MSLDGSSSPRTTLPKTRTFDALCAFAMVRISFRCCLSNLPRLDLARNSLRGTS